MEWLSEIEFNEESGTDAFRMLVNHLKYLRKDLLEVNKKIRALSKKNITEKRKIY